MVVTFKNDKTGELKKVKVGWSWILFFGTGFLFGIPHFLRGLTVWGAFVAGLGVISLFFSDPTPKNIPILIMLTILSVGLSIFFGIKGNEITAKNYLEKGWKIDDPESQGTKYAKTKWGLS